jgi:hypothetical protein
MKERHPNLVTYDDLNERAKERAEHHAIEGIDRAYRANKAHTAMQNGELVVTDDSSFSKPHDAKETFDALVHSAGGLIGRDTIGSLAYQALYTRQKYYRKS